MVPFLRDCYNFEGFCRILYGEIVFGGLMSLLNAAHNDHVFYAHGVRYLFGEAV